MKTILLVFSTLAIAAGCSHGNCRDQAAKRNAASGGEIAKPQNNSLETGEAAVRPTDRVRVFKYDGTLQCNQGKQIPLAEMQKELAGIQVFGSQNKRDSLMRVQRCGMITGNANVYEISRADLDQAKRLGFQLWTFE